MGAYRIARFAHMVGECICRDVACRVAIDNLRVAINNLRTAIQIPIAIIRLP